MLKTLFKNKAIADGADYTNTIQVEELNRVIFQVDHTTAVTELAGVTLTLSTQDSVICRRIPMDVLHAIAKQNGATTGSATHSIFPVGIGALYFDDDEELTYLIENNSGETQTVDMTIEHGLNKHPMVLEYSKRVDLNFSLKNVELLALTGSAMDEATTLISVKDSKGDTSLPVLGYNAVMNADGAYDTMVLDFTILWEGAHPDDLMVEASDLTIGTDFFLVVSTQDEPEKAHRQIQRASIQAGRTRRNLSDSVKRVARRTGRILPKEGK